LNIYPSSNSFIRLFILQSFQKLLKGASNSRTTKTEVFRRETNGPWKDARLKTFGNAGLDLSMYKVCHCTGASTK